MAELVWTTSDGVKVAPSEMSSVHRVNVLRKAARNVSAQLKNKGDFTQYDEKVLISTAMNIDPLIRLIGWEEGYSCSIISNFEVLGAKNSSEAKSLSKLIANSGYDGYNIGDK